MASSYPPAEIESNGRSETPMSDNRQKSLNSLCPKLETNIMVDNFLSSLHCDAGGFLNDHELQVIDSKGSNFKKVRELISILKGKDNASFDKFCSVLVSVRYGHWARKLLEQAEIPSVQPGRNGVDDSPSRQASANICFAIMVANNNEWESAMHFLGAEGYRVAEEVKPWTCTAEDADDSLKEVKLISYGGSVIYPVLSVGNKTGIIFSCAQKGSFGKSASRDETVQLFNYASKEKWSLKVIFVVGCCGAVQNQPIQKGAQGGTANVPNGTVFVADTLYSYTGKIEKEINIKLDPHSMSKYWNSLLKKVSGRGKWEIKPIDLVPFYSGDFVMKNHEVSVDLSANLKGHKKVGYEMEGIGVVGVAPEGTVALVKGVSDNAGFEKKTDAPIRFFSKDIEKPVNENTRQQMCTVMSLAVVLRAIAADNQKLV